MDHEQIIAAMSREQVNTLLRLLITAILTADPSIRHVLTIEILREYGINE